MKKKTQNILKFIMPNTIKLGIELYDVDYDNELVKDLSTNNMTFKSLTIKDNIDKCVNDFLFPNKSYNKQHAILEFLCHDTKNTYTSIYHIGNNSLQLKILITALCEAFGNNINLNWIDVSSLTNLNEVFKGKIEFDISSGQRQIKKNLFNGDISLWDVSNVKSMESMFFNSDFNGDISKWDVSNVENMSHMFFNSKFNQDISLWKTSKLRTVTHMFENSEFNGDISHWDVHNVKSMHHMFYGSKFNGDLNTWDVGNVENMSSMFQKSQFNSDISAWNTSNVTVMLAMFNESKFNMDISKWNISNVQDMSWMFAKSEFNQDIAKWDVSNVIYMGSMFANSKFNNDISMWDIHYAQKYGDTDGMFSSCPIETRYLPINYGEK